MPGRNDPNPELVVIAGKLENSVYDCVNYLRAMEEDYIDELIVRGAYNPHQSEPQQNTQKKSSQQMEITGAPWQLDSMEQFPAMGVANAAPSSQPPVAAGVWGQRRW